MAQPIILKHNQILVLRAIGKAYGHALSFSNVRISPTGGALCDWKISSEAWDRLNTVYQAGCADIEISREELNTYLDWFDRQEKDELEFRSLTGRYRPRTPPEQSLFVYLKLAQAFNYPQDMKKGDE